MEKVNKVGYEYVDFNIIQDQIIQIIKHSTMTVTIKMTKDIFYLNTEQSDNNSMCIILCPLLIYLLEMKISVVKLSACDNIYT